MGKPLGGVILVCFFFAACGEAGHHLVSTYIDSCSLVTVQQANQILRKPNGCQNVSLEYLPQAESRC